MRKPKRTDTAAYAAKQSGLKSLSVVTKHTGICGQTLINWFRNRPELFDVVINGSKVKEGEATGMATFAADDAEILNELSGLLYAYKHEVMTCGNDGKKQLDDIRVIAPIALRSIANYL